MGMFLFLTMTKVSLPREVFSYTTSNWSPPLPDSKNVTGGLTLALRTSTNFYRPRMGAPLPEAVAYKHTRDKGQVNVEESPLTVLVPTRYIAFDTTNPANDFDVNVLGATDPRVFMQDNDFQVTYSFSRAIRDNKFNFVGLLPKPQGEYGTPGITFRQLYDFLCTEYNGGERFIDTYFQQIFPTSPVGRQFAAFEEQTKEDLTNEYFDRAMAALARKTTKAGLPNMTTREGKYLKDFDVWKKATVISRLGRIREEVRGEIIASLSTGKIPLLHRNSPATLKARAKLGLNVGSVFFASGQLIRDIQIDIRMPEDSFA
jgi:hypothetical protein